ncbi:MAG: dihydrolipoyl dehydrogenase, partial [Deltaproteobacteria bacterium]|nr:dihydrolipoyl dehydrogenase [Deltaproteobacteria bacterium]
AAVLERVRAERDRFVGFVVRDTESLPDRERLRGRARFLGPTTLEVAPLAGARAAEPTRVEAKAVVVAAGSAPFVPPLFDAMRNHVMVSDDIFELKDVPASVAVIGTGIIGLELGQALGRLGARVAFFNRSASLGPFSDPELRRVVRDTLGQELTLHLESEMLEALPDGDGVRLRWRGADGVERDDGFERVLVAAGRRPSLADLDLERAGIALNARGQPLWNPTTAQIGDKPVFLAGDVSGHLPLLHEASDEGRIAGANAASYPEVTAHQRRVRLVIAFTDPQMAMLGVPYRELDLDAVEIGEVSYADQGRARVAGRNQGLVRLYAQRQGCQLIGAEMFGPRVEHMAHLLAWAVQEGMTVQHILRMPFYHPVFEEGLRTALRGLAEKLRVTGDCRCEDLSDAPGA